MKVWIVCDNNAISTIKVFESLGKAQKYVNQYTGYKKDDCWIFNSNGSEIETGVDYVTSAEDRYGRQLGAVKPLAQYLSKYLDDLETCGAYGVTGDTGDLEDTINRALDAYQSTEQVKIRIERV